jgi:hypothetical protein
MTDTYFDPYRKQMVSTPVIDQGLRTIAALTIANHVVEALDKAWIEFAEDSQHEPLVMLKAAFKVATSDVIGTEEVTIRDHGDPGDDNFLD